MRFFRHFKKYPFLVMLCLSTVIFTVIGYAGKNNIYSGCTVVLANTPELAAVFEGAGEGKYPWMITNKPDTRIMLSQSSNNSGNSGSSVVQSHTSKNSNEIAVDSRKKSDKNHTTAKRKSIKSNPSDSEESKKKVNDSLRDNNSDSKAAKDISAEKTSKSNADKRVEKKTSSNKEENVVSTRGKRKELTRADEYKFDTVKKNYFKDALFIGDSRTVGLSEYSDLQKATYYADVGLTIYDVFDKKIAEVDGNKRTILEALQIKKFKKIYIMLGINELGTGTEDTFCAQYEKVINKIRKLQPDAIIYIEAIMNVAKEKSDTDPVYNNSNIRKRNECLIKLADNSKVFYINVNDLITDRKGNLPSKYTFDSVHLKAAYYKLWTDFLLTHGILK